MVSLAVIRTVTQIQSVTTSLLLDETFHGARFDDRALILWMVAVLMPSTPSSRLHRQCR